jgi:hypothetical protein
LPSSSATRIKDSSRDRSRASETASIGGVVFLFRTVFFDPTCDFDLDLVLDFGRAMMGTRARGGFELTAANR